ncbi:MAG: tetraacyldisaccharide 4'-kinase [Bacteroidales bacterium]|nr:tetraacyldisaccharide 4'-kinase [Candidatus Equibacterium intestinale]
MPLVLSKIILFPYYLALKVRNAGYDKGKKETVHFDNIKVVSIGNVTVGGTGKTPHVEMFIRHYLDNCYRVAVVSLGYGRQDVKSCKFVKTSSTAAEVGDEPLQIKRKFPNVPVVVCQQREKAIEELMKLPFGDVPEVVILDDAMQYRRLVPDRQIALIRCDSPIFKDNLLPFGRLRDLPEQIERADTVIFTKCPLYLTESGKQQLKEENHLLPGQKVFFTSVDYGEPVAVFPTGNNRYIYSKEAILLTGIADSIPVRDWTNARYPINHHIDFGDHHAFTKKDIALILRTAAKYPRAIILTTEKDAQRFLHNELLTDAIRERMYYIPIRTLLLEEESEEGLYDLN